jgi:hypothetical protein
LHDDRIRPSFPPGMALYPVIPTSRRANGYPLAANGMVPVAPSSVKQSHHAGIAGDGGIGVELG